MVQLTLRLKVKRTSEGKQERFGWTETRVRVGVQRIQQVFETKSLTEDEERLSIEYIMSTKLDNKKEQDARKDEIEKKETSERIALEKLKSLNQGWGDSKIPLLSEMWLYDGALEEDSALDAVE